MSLGTDQEEENTLLRLKIAELERQNSELAAKNLELENQLVSAKIAFADSVIGMRDIANSAKKPYAEATRTKHSESNSNVAAVLIASATEKITIKQIDELMESKKGPVPQAMTQNENRVFITFSSAEKRQAAKKIIEETPSGKRLFTGVSEKHTLFPLIIRHVDVTQTESELLADLKRRNENFADYVEKVHTFWVSPSKNSAHLKLWLKSKLIRDDILNYGFVYFTGRRCKVCPIDPNKEVRPCSRCCKYGHGKR